MPEIITCFKQVIDESEIKVDRANNRIVLEGAKTKISDDDKNAIEEAVKIKEKNGGSITAITVGTTDAKKSAKEALAMGCDRARLVVDPLFQDCDAMNTAFILTQAIKKIGKYDLILTATGTTDSSSSVVGPSLAEQLDLPFISYAMKISITGSKVSIERSMEDGIETVECDFPVVVSVSREINQPRFPTLIQIMSAGKKEMIEWNAQALGIDPSRIGKSASKVTVSSLSVPQSARKKILFEGKPEDAAKQLTEAVIREGVVA
ncbi:MAG: electron transfer flavoprotein subunit beta/FixA family protein [Nitrososphaerota archaeon]|nr:electron transfer flavoprotein subunit beta/FixA family protein [Nitrososphaerota archaeon]MDG6924228.1 electron transfer flavoprotein subunit beta/FixA family protein [Nitrososphaerota archaeon]